MYKVLIALFLFLCDQGKALQHLHLKQNYNFLLVDKKINQLHQSNDTLYEFKADINPGLPLSIKNHYKILQCEQKGSFTIVKLERLDSLPGKPKRFLENRYFVFIMQKITDQQLGLLMYGHSMLKNQLDTVTITHTDLEQLSFYTYFSDAYLKDLAQLKQITTIEEATFILNLCKKEGQIPHQANDLYAAAGSAEILNRVCIRNGYSPIGAGPIITHLLRK